MVEVLVVVVVLATLAALAIPSFMGQNDKALDVEAKSAVAKLELNIESCAMVERPDYAACADADKVGDGVAWGDGPGEASVISAGAVNYRLQAVSRADTDGPHRFWLEKQDGVVERTCAPAGAGGCPEDGTW